MVDHEAIQSILEQVEGYLSQPDVDVFWAGFKTPGEARQEISTLYTAVLAGDRQALDKLRCWFAPTGVLQEVAVSNGWGDSYLELASRFDRAIGEVT